MNIIKLISSNLFLLFFIFVNAKGSKIEVEVETDSGKFKGLADTTTRLGKKIYSFRGIRYAEPPTGPLRFKPAVLINKYKNTFDATEDGPACPQPGPLTQSEDCLRLNIYTTTKLPITQKAIEKKPVIVFIHPGAFYVFSGQNIIVGPEYILDQDVVFVTINYRLGSLGFLSTGDHLAPGNLGLKDQVVALKWIKNNIKYFGGDENLVTLAGSSAGGWSITAHLVSPMSKNLFHRVILSSGSAIYQSPLPSHQKHLAIKQAQILNCPSNSSVEILNCLSTKNATTIANSLSEFFEWHGQPILLWTPVIEPELPGVERFLTGQPADLIRAGKFHQVPVIVGITLDEFGSVVTPLVEQAEMGNNKLFDDLNANWTKLAPILFWYERNTQRSNDISSSFKKFYFNDEPIGLSNWKSLANVFGDAVGFQAHRFVNLISQYSSQPVYYYKFTYQGRYSHATWSNGTVFGVCHHDDLLYLFYDTYFPYFKNNNDPELITVERMTSMYGNFAKTGVPIPKNNSYFKNIIWERFTTENKKYLDIGNDLVMKTGLYADRMQLWDKYFNF
ncbi:esterase FE4-like [Aphidius gifuensis]|uniref:esterase FE4-like n=1 Tax=Aphidius gifuensis TaxID=684658 RepID=UPI001CDC455A|nr:esterase FE4-like [Aphidius gifuensis]